MFPSKTFVLYYRGANDCLIIKAANVGNQPRVKLKVRYFDVEHHYACDKDYLEIRDGT